MLELLDESSEQLLGLARDEAEPLRHNAVNPLHLLLAVLREAEGPTSLGRRIELSGLPAGLTHDAALTDVARRMPPERDAAGGYLPASPALMSVLYEAARDAASQAPSGKVSAAVRASHLRAALLRAPEVVALLEEMSSDPNNIARDQGPPSGRRATANDQEEPEMEAVLPAEYQFGSELEPDWDERPE